MENNTLHSDYEANSNEFARANQMQDELTRILLVDDEESILLSLQEVLAITHQDYRVSVATSAEEALSILEQHDIDVLVTDFRLPQMSGLELTQNLGEISPQTRSILMTAYGNQQILHRAGDNGCVAYLEKPFDVDRFVDCINSALYPPSALKVELSGLGLADVIQLYARNQQSKVLRVVTDESSGLVILRDGIVIHAQFAEFESAEALLAMLDSRNARVSSIECELPTRQTLSLTWHAIQQAMESNDALQRIKILRGNDAIYPRFPLRLKKHQVDLETLKKPLLSSPNLEKHERMKLVDAFRPSRSSSQPQEEDLALRELEDDTHVPSNFGSNDVSRIEYGRDFEDDELSLGEDEIQSPELKAEMQAKAHEFVNRGIKHFQAYDLVSARRCWVAALTIDPESVAAKRNLEILERVEDRSKSLH